MKLSEKLDCRRFFWKKWNFPKIHWFLLKMGKIFELQESAIIWRKKFLVIATNLKKYWQRAKSSTNSNLTTLRPHKQVLWKRRLSNFKTSLFWVRPRDFGDFFINAKAPYRKGIPQRLQGFQKAPWMYSVGPN